MAQTEGLKIEDMLFTDKVHFHQQKYSVGSIQQSSPSYWNISSSQNLIIYLNLYIFTTSYTIDLYVCYCVTVKYCCSL
jgi:hypothetical protein